MGRELLMPLQVLNVQNLVCAIAGHGAWKASTSIDDLIQHCGAQKIGSCMPFVHVFAERDAQLLAKHSTVMLWFTCNESQGAQHACRPRCECICAVR